MHVYAVVTVATAVAAWLLTPLCGRLAKRLGVVDKPDIRKVHKEPVPYFGGVAIFLALIVGGAASVFLAKDAAATLGRADTAIYTILASATLIFLTGLADDVRQLRARHKLLLQMLAAFAVCAAGVRIEHLHITDDFSIEFGLLSWPLTMLWIVGLTNAVNLIDGLDGLATGIGAIACAAIGYTIWGHLSSPNTPPQLALLCALLGALLGFLPHNHRPAKIFLGDAGSLLIGFLLATLSLTSNSKSATFATVAVPAMTVVALGIPVFDTLFAMLRRVLEGRGIMSPDRNHVHHRLVARGLSHQRTVYVLWAETGLISGAAIILTQLDVGNPARFAILGLVLTLHVGFFRHIGAVRLRESYLAVKAVASRASAADQARRSADELDLHFSLAACPESWWSAMTLTAERMGFTRLQLDYARSDQSPRLWESDSPLRPHHLEATLPLQTGEQASHAELRVCIQGRSAEEASEKLLLFSRLLDRHAPTDHTPRATVDDRLPRTREPQPTSAIAT